MTLFQSIERFPIENFKNAQQNLKKLGKLKFWKGRLLEIFHMYDI